MDMPENKEGPRVAQSSNIEGWIAVVIVIGTLVFISQANYLMSRVPTVAAVISSVLVELTNVDRATQGLGTLTVSPVLTEVAQAKANDMAAKGYFAHTSPEGLTPWHWFKEKGYRFAYAGENLAVDFSESADVQRAWMNSPTHRANVVGTQFTEIGIATANGTYNGRPTTFVVQVFGTPARPITATPQSATTTVAVQTRPEPPVVDVVPNPVSDIPAVATTLPTSASPEAILGQSAGSYLASSNNVPLWFKLVSFFVR
ncbi:MAG: CAP domain-containing protein [Candidatus Pacebacteria bacterium]|nr:CAP domain-containing protein [Candidatus Paceibacterota bacterium]